MRPAALRSRERRNQSDTGILSRAVCTLSLLLPLATTATATTTTTSTSLHVSLPASERLSSVAAIIIIIIEQRVGGLQAPLLRPVGISSQLTTANQRTPGLAASKTRESGLAP